MNSALARSIAGLSSQWRNRFLPWKKSSKSGHLRRGARGEKLACRFLKRSGYKILFRNFRGRSGGEIDVVCRDNDTLVFVEVKTRTREDFGRPLEAVDRAKQKRISRGALAWLRMLDNPDILFRFDVVEVIIVDEAKPRVELIKNAFPLSKPYLY
jgi:putative endonuclease